MRYSLAIGRADLVDYVVTPIGTAPDRETANAMVLDWTQLPQDCSTWIYDHPEDTWYRFSKAETGVPIWRVEGLPTPHRFCRKPAGEPCRCHVCTGRPRRAPLWAILATVHTPRHTTAVR